MWLVSLDFNNSFELPAIFYFLSLYFHLFSVFSFFKNVFNKFQFIRASRIWEFFWIGWGCLFSFLKIYSNSNKNTFFLSLLLLLFLSEHKWNPLIQETLALHSEMWTLGWSTVPLSSAEEFTFFSLFLLNSGIDTTISSIQIMEIQQIIDHRYCSRSLQCGWVRLPSTPQLFQEFTPGSGCFE